MLKLMKSSANTGSRLYSILLSQSFFSLCQVACLCFAGPAKGHLFMSFTLRVHTEWQPPLFGIHSLMMEKLAQAGEGGSARPPPYTIVTITYKVSVCAPAEWAETLTLSVSSLPISLLCGFINTALHTSPVNFRSYTRALLESSYL
jgi:hypothetical protein